MNILLSPNEVKQYELNILKDVSHFCDEHNIHYSLFFGTLIGSIRHEGFIPWDDDIDIVIPRDEYEWFMHNYNHNRYKAVDSTIDSAYPYAFGKVIDRKTIIKEKTSSPYQIGVYIDVFPVDGLPLDNEAFYRYKCELLCRMALYKMVSLDFPTDFLHKLIHVLIKVPLALFKQSSIVNIQNKAAQRYSINESKQASVLTVRVGCKGCFKKESFLRLMKHKFEDAYFNIPEDYNSMLTQIYGDYMTPPPEDERVAHYFEAYRVDEPN